MEYKSIRVGAALLLLALISVMFAGCGKATGIPAVEETQQPPSISDAATPEGTVSGTVKWKMEKVAGDDSPAYVYYWSDEDRELVKWPGDPMMQNGDTYTFTVPSSAQYILFSGGTKLQQTVGISLDGSGTDYVVTEKKNKNGHYLVAAPDGRELPPANSYIITESVSSAQMAAVITETSVEEEFGDSGVKDTTHGGVDALLFKVKNNGAETVEHLKMYVICFDEYGYTIHPETGEAESENEEYETDLLAIDFSGDLAGHKTETYIFNCGLNGTVRCEAVIAEYVIDMVQYKNADAEAWANQYITEK